MEKPVWIKFKTLFANEDNDLERLGINTKEQFEEEDIFIDITKVISFNGGSRDNTTTLEIVTGSRWTVQTKIENVIALFTLHNIILQDTI